MFILSFMALWFCLKWILRTRQLSDKLGCNFQNFQSSAPYVFLEDCWHHFGVITASQRYIHSRNFIHFPYPHYLKWIWTFCTREVGKEYCTSKILHVDTFLGILGKRTAKVSHFTKKCFLQLCPIHCNRGAGEEPIGETFALCASKDVN